MSIRKELFVFMGPPGSGKGSLSNLCIQELKWVQLSTGNLCRKHIQEQTEIGRSIAFAIKSGNLISDDLIMSMVEEWLTETMQHASPIILDGFPRALPQARAFDKLLKEKFTDTTLHIINFSVPDEQILTRLTGRIICKNSRCQTVYSTKEQSLQPKNAMKCDNCSEELIQREDDELSAARDRLVIYHKHTQDLLNFYAQEHRSVLHLNATAPLLEVFKEFKTLVGLKNI